MNQNNEIRAFQPSINRNSYTPLYVQVKDSVREAIEQSVWTPGSQIMAETEMCQLFGVSRIVIRQALKELEYEGILYRIKGKGTFVAEPKMQVTQATRLTGTFQDMVDHGHIPETRVYRQEIQPASIKVARFLNLEVDEQVVVMDRLRLIDGEPFVYGTTYVPFRLCPQLINADLVNNSLYNLLNAYGLEICYSRRYIEAVLANKVEAKILNIEKSAPLILIDSISYLKDSTPVEYFHTVHRGDRERLVIDIGQPPEV